LASRDALVILDNQVIKEFPAKTEDLLLHVTALKRSENLVTMESMVTAVSRE